MDAEMRNIVRFLLISMASVLLLLSQVPMAYSEGRFVDNGDGTVTDTRRHLMWQQDDNGEEVTFEGAQKYCRALRLGGYTDWRLPEPEEQATAVVTALMMRMHSRDVYARFDLYWSSSATTLIPFNYHPSYGREVQRTYPAKAGDRAFVKAVRSLGAAKEGSGR